MSETHYAKAIAGIRKLYIEAREFRMRLELHRMEFCGMDNAHEHEHGIDEGMKDTIEALKLFDTPMEEYLFRMGRGG